MAFTFKGGIHPEGHKEATAYKPIELLPAPPQIVLPLSMNLGSPCQSLVQKGDRVYLGQKIADSDAPVSAPIHATVSGTVADIAPRYHPDGTEKLSIMIDNDYTDEVHPSVQAVEVDLLSQEEVVAAIREAGIVGHGGAAFPAHAKITAALGSVTDVIINAAECEPYLTADHRILLEYPWEVVGGAQILLKLFDVRQVKLGVERNKGNAFAVLEEYLPPNGSIQLCPLVTKYPQGAEKQLIYALLKREIPTGKRPADAGCIVFNADTVASIYRLFTTGMPMVRRIVTVAGSAVANPKNLEVRIGTPVEYLLAACGGLVAPPQRMVMGGPMMGNPLFSDQVPVVKGTNGILAFCKDEYVSPKHPHCIRCGKCVRHCPMGLMPTYLYLSAAKGSYDMLEEYHCLDCMECGTCTYVCPGKVPLVQGIRAGKQRLHNRKMPDRRKNLR